MIQTRRLSITLSVYYSLLQPEGASPPDTVLMALHGFGQRCDHFIQLFEPLRTKDILVVAPQAPHPFYLKMNPKTVGFTWLTQYERDQAIRDFIGYMDRLLEELQRSEKIRPHRLFFLGFSQGVSMAYRYAVHGRYPVSGLIACGADLPPDVAERLPHIQPFPVLLIHGLEDAVVPLSKCLEAERILTRYRYPVETFHFQGGHKIPGEGIALIGRWISARP